jgi:hypothetical protein
MVTAMCEAVGRRISLRLAPGKKQNLLPEKRTKGKKKKGSGCGSSGRTSTQQGLGPEFKDTNNKKN